jgi:epoxyqueuosine reductase
MTFMARHGERRADPVQQWPDVRTVICVAAAYGAPTPEPVGYGRIAAYAAGPDYHDWLLARLQTLGQFVAEVAGRPVRFQAYTDTAPVFERELAVRAGLGWRGRNSCLVSRLAGSYTLLGELFTDLELAPDAPTPDGCGRCRRCLDACPTGALVQPYVLDSRRCLAYLTIEHRGALPRAVRPLMGTRVFGCDACQEVCPWNRRVRPGWPGPGSALAVPALVDLLALDSAGFRRHFGSTPVARARRRGLRRNAAVALGNTGDRANVLALARVLNDDDPQVRGHAAWALGRLGGSVARAALEAASRREADPEAALEVQLALAETAPV